MFWAQLLGYLCPWIITQLCNFITCTFSEFLPWPTWTLQPESTSVRSYNICVTSDESKWLCLDDVLRTRCENQLFLLRQLEDFWSSLYFNGIEAKLLHVCQHNHVFGNCSPWAIFIWDIIKNESIITTLRTFLFLQPFPAGNCCEHGCHPVMVDLAFISQDTILTVTEFVITCNKVDSLCFNYLLWDIKFLHFKQGTIK